MCIRVLWNIPLIPTRRLFVSLYLRKVIFNCFKSKYIFNHLIFCKHTYLPTEGGLDVKTVLSVPLRRSRPPQDELCLLFSFLIIIFSWWQNVHTTSSPFPICWHSGASTSSRVVQRVKTAATPRPSSCCSALQQSDNAERRSAPVPVSGLRVAKGSPQQRGFIQTWHPNLH